MNIFDFALKMEEDGKKYYEDLAEKTSVPGFKTIFLRLAEDEQKHFEIFQKLINKQSSPAMKESNVMAEAKNIFERLAEEKDTLKGTEESLAAYQHAMKIEAESFQLYEKAAKETKDPATKKLLLKIAAEEHKHFNILENVYLFVNAPNQYLAWAESSNLGDLKQFGRDV